MSKGVNVRLTNKLQNFIAEQIGTNGLYENASEYVRDLIRRDYMLHEERKWKWFYEQIAPGMKAKENEFIPFEPESIIREAKKQKTGQAGYPEKAVNEA